MKQTKEVAVLLVLSLAGASIWYWQSRQDMSTGGVQALPARYTPSVEDLRIRPQGAARTTEYQSSGHNPFVPRVAHPHLLKVTGDPGISTSAEQIRLELSYKFFGYGTVPNGTPKLAFLTDGQEVYVVAEGDTVLGRFRILKIANATIDFEEISSGRRGRANMEDAGPTT